eukprot:5940290-Alexandrium_andersonii.AAC.1
MALYGSESSPLPGCEAKAMAAKIKRVLTPGTTSMASAELAALWWGSRCVDLHFVVLLRRAKMARRVWASAEQYRQAFPD